MLYGATFSLNCFPAENAGTLVAGMVIGSLVFGLRPSRSERSRHSNDPNPTSVTLSPLATASVTTNKKALITSSACFFVMLVFAATASTNSPLFINHPEALPVLEIYFTITSSPNTVRISIFHFPYDLGNGFAGIG
uniref:Uncharacterized protein n=1 Tax=Nostoc flagelliforme str. Sunitezuoqi TaxID=676037 RepID=E7DPW9_9NOSO|nr:hypothetical protein Nfla_5103 [Nostoc flagelliforme str. Sunitezuoqi]